MSRGGRGGGRGSRRGPDLSYDDSEQSPQSNKPAPTFPRVDFPPPKPLDDSELATVNTYLSYRKKIRSGPFFSILEASSLTDDKGKVDHRAGFDPFNHQETYSSKSQLLKRTTPDFMDQPAHLQFFPKELWHIIDPKRKHPLWQTLEGPLAGGRPKKRKRRLTNDAEQNPTQKEEQDSDEDSDVIVTGRRKHTAARSRKTDPTTKSAKQKQGLDAEDDYPDGDPNEDDDPDVDDAPQDSEFEDSEDDANDYNAEAYFDGGDDEDLGVDEGGDDDTYG